MSLIKRQPLRNPGARGFENFRQFATRPTFGVQHYRLHPFRHAIGTIPLCLFAQGNQSTMRLRMQSQHARNHGYPSKKSMPHLLSHVLLLMRICIATLGRARNSNVPTAPGCREKTVRKLFARTATTNFEPRYYGLLGKEDSDE